MLIDSSLIVPELPNEGLCWHQEVPLTETLPPDGHRESPLGDKTGTHSQPGQSQNTAWDACLASQSLRRQEEESLNPFLDRSTLSASDLPLPDPFWIPQGICCEATGQEGGSVRALPWSHLGQAKHVEAYGQEGGTGRVGDLPQDPLPLLLILVEPEGKAKWE